MTLYYINRSINIVCVVNLSAMAKGGGVDGNGMSERVPFFTCKSVNFWESSRVGVIIKIFDAVRENLVDIMMIS